MRNFRRSATALLSATALTTLILTTGETANAVATDQATAVAECQTTFGFGAGPEPLAGCQWDMRMIGAGPSTAWLNATGRGVRVGVIDSGVDVNHPDIKPNLDLALSCSFITTGTPTADPSEVANGDCTNKAAVQDRGGHGTHVASTIAAPVNGIGIAGVAPGATIVALKACTEVGYCFADAVAGALRYAGDVRLDVVNLSLFADPYLFYCKNAAEQRAILKSLQDAAKYAQQRGVVIVAAAGNESQDLGHPTTDEISPDWPPNTNITRTVRNNCRVAPAELPGVVTVSALGVNELAGYSTIGNVVDVAAPGGDALQLTPRPYGRILAAWSSIDDGSFDFWTNVSAEKRALTIGGARYAWISGTSMASPHVAGVAALIRQRHPNWSSGAVAAAIRRSATPKACPTGWPATDPRQCRGSAANTSFYGSGTVNALGASGL